MSINRSKLWLALGLPLVFASLALGQELPDNEWVPGVRDFQPFAPASSTTSMYGSGPKRQRGWFLTIEDLAWSTNAPQRTTIGNADHTPLVSYDGQQGSYFRQPNSLDTAFIQPGLRQGERLQLGYVGEDGKGWMVGTFALHTQTSTTSLSNAGVSFFQQDVPPGVAGNETEGFIDSYLNGASIFGNGPLILDTDVNHNGTFGQDGRALFQNIGGVNTLVAVVPAPIDYGDLIQLPIVFQQTFAKYSSNAFGIEVMRTWWLSKSRRNDHGYWDFMAGVRYLRFRDQFYFAGTASDNSVVLNATTPFVTVTGPIHEIGGVLANTYFNQTAANYLVAPQVALRWTKQRGRLGWNVEGRFAPAANFQTARQNGAIADRTDASGLNVNMVRLPIDNNLVLVGHNAATGALPALQYDTPFLHSAGVSHTSHSTQFSPIGELRLNATYQIFRNIQATVGWTGLVVGGIARSPNMVSYTLPDMGILNTGNRQVLFIQGINFGFNINR